MCPWLCLEEGYISRNVLLTVIKGRLSCWSRTLLFQSIIINRKILKLLIIKKLKKLSSKVFTNFITKKLQINMTMNVVNTTSTIKQIHVELLLLLAADPRDA